VSKYCFAQAPAASLAEAAPALSEDAVPQAGRIRICSASAALHCAEPGAAALELRRRAEAAGGWMQKQEGDSLELRLPATVFEAFLKELGGLGEVVELRRQVDDVTERFHDLELRLGNAEAALQRLRELLGKQGKVEDLLKVEQEISRLSGEIESLKGQRRLIEHDSRFSRLSLRLVKHEAELAGVQTPFSWLGDLAGPVHRGQFVAHDLDSGFGLELSASLLVVRRDSRQLRALSAEGLLISAERHSIGQAMAPEFWEVLLSKELRQKGRKDIAIRRFQAWGERPCLVFEDAGYVLYFLAGADQVLTIECRGEARLRPAGLEAAVAAAEVSLNEWARH
jgi:hypothetical protein